MRPEHRRVYPPKKRDKARIAFYSALGAFFLWGFVLESFLFLRTDYTVSIPTLPVGCEGVRIAVAGDWHIGSEHVSPARAKRLAQEVADTQPDLILLPGDFLAHGILFKTLPMETIAPSLAPLAKAAPVYAVLGNHDHVGFSPIQIITPLNKQGITVVFNANTEVSLRKGACKFRLVGIADNLVGISSPGMALEGIPKGEVKIGLTHTPSIYPEVANKLDLLVAGHTHGGVLCVPLTKLCVSRFSAWGSEWIKGAYQPEGFRAPLIINNGVGNSILPLRFSAPPGYDILTLHRGGVGKTTIREN